MRLQTEYIEAERLLKIELTKDKQIFCRFGEADHYFNGYIQQIYNDKDGNAIAYDVYVV